MCECVLRARACVRRRVARVRKCARASVINDVVSPIAGLSIMCQVSITTDQ